MPRSARHKSHKQSKHGPKEGKEHSESEKEDVKKMKDNRNNSEGSVIRVSRDSSSSEKRKLGKDLTSRDNGGEEYLGSKRRKEKADDRWTGGGGGEEDGGATVAIKEVKGEILRIDGDNKSKDSKPLGDSKRIDGEKIKSLWDSKSKSSRRHESGGEKKDDSVRRHESGSEKKDDNVGLLADKEESKSGTSRVESKRKSEKDSGLKEVQQSKDLKYKERGLEKERKIAQDVKREKEVATVDIEVARKQGENRQGKHGRENTGKVTNCCVYGLLPCGYCVVGMLSNTCQCP